MVISYRNFGEITPYYGKKQRIIYTLVNKDGRWADRVVDAPVVLDSALTGDTVEIRWGPLGGDTVPPRPTAVVAYSPEHRLVVNAASTGGVPSGVRIDVPTFDLKPGDISRAIGSVAPTFFPAASVSVSPPVPVGPQYEIGDTGPQGGTVVAITPGPAPVPPPAPVPEAAPPQILTPAPVPVPAQPTGQTTVVDLPGAGPTPVPVMVGPVDRPVIQAGPGGRPVVVLPVWASNLPNMPAREAVRARLVEEEQEGLPPGLYDPDEFFPLYVRKPLPIRALPARGSARQARGGAEADQVDVSLYEIQAGAPSAGQRYPKTRAIRTLPTRAPSPDGLVPTAEATPATREATPETDGAVLVQVPANSAAQVPAAGPRGPGMAILIAGAGGGFVIAGPIGAAVGAAAALFLGRK